MPTGNYKDPTHSPTATSSPNLDFPTSDSSSDLSYSSDYTNFLFVS
jgi:hypothetical protein